MRRPAAARRPARGSRRCRENWGGAWTTSPTRSRRRAPPAKGRARIPATDAAFRWFSNVSCGEHQNSCGRWNQVPGHVQTAARRCHPRMKPFARRRDVLLVLLVSLPVTGISRASAEPSDQPAPERIMPLTREQLSNKVPQFYDFIYHAQPQPGKRYWLRVGDDTWIERYPDGFQSRFKTLGHITVKARKARWSRRSAAIRRSPAPTTGATSKPSSRTRAANRCTTCSATWSATTRDGTTSARCWTWSETSVPLATSGAITFHLPVVLTSVLFWL